MLDVPETPVVNKGDKMSGITLFAPESGIESFESLAEARAESDETTDNMASITSLIFSIVFYC